MHELLALLAPSRALLVKLAPKLSLAPLHLLHLCLPARCLSRHASPLRLNGLPLVFLCDGREGEALRCKPFLRIEVGGKHRILDQKLGLCLIGDRERSLHHRVCMTRRRQRGWRRRRSH